MSKWTKLGGALAQAAMPKLQQRMRQPQALDMTQMDQSLTRSGNMLRKGISRMRQMKKGGKIKVKKPAARYPELRGRVKS